MNRQSGSKRTNARDMGKYLASLTPFHTTNIVGHDNPWDWGNPGNWWSYSDPEFQKFQYDLTTRGIDFVVYSFSTPIAWHVKGGDWIIPIRKYSPTTSKQQNQLRNALYSTGTVYVDWDEGVPLETGHRIDHIIRTVTWVQEVLSR